MSRSWNSKTWFSRRRTFKFLRVDQSARADFYRSMVRRGEASFRGGERLSLLVLILWCFVLLLLFRDVAEEARQRGERTAAQCVDETREFSPLEGL